MSSRAMLKPGFFSADAQTVARNLIGTIIRRKVKKHWLAVRIIETEAYYLDDKASHSSLGFTEKRKAMFMPPGTIYMYYARGHDSLNVSCGNKGDAVLIKAAYPYFDKLSPQSTLPIMQKLNPAQDGSMRAVEKLCSGQTLLCKSLNLKVIDWDQQQFDPGEFYIEEAEHPPGKIIRTTRLGIHKDRDAHLHYRFIDYQYAKYCSSNPLSKKSFKENQDYIIQEQ